MKSLSLRVIIDSDIEMIYMWFLKEHIAKWIGNPQDWLKEIQGRNNTFSYIKHFIVLSDNEPIAFCQYYDCSKVEDNSNLEKLDGVYGIDYMIAYEHLLGKGIGRKIVQMICEKAIFSEENIKQFTADPDAKNIPSIKTLLSNGFVHDSKTDLYIKKL